MASAHKNKFQSVNDNTGQKQLFIRPKKLAPSPHFYILI